MNGTEKTMKKISRRVLILFLFALLTACGVDAQDSRSQSSDCNQLVVQVLGAGGPEVNDGMASSSFIIWINAKARIMVDAGGGSSLNFEKSGANLNDLDALLFTHLHVDHTAALPVYVKAGYFSGRNRDLPVFGPAAGGDFPSTSGFIQALFSDQQKSVYPYLSDNYRQLPTTDFLIRPEDVDPQNSLWEKKLSEKLSLSAINVTHGNVPALAWRVDYGTCSITFSGDMNSRSGHLQKLAVKTNLLVASNAIPEDAGRVAKFLHMTPSQIGTIAKKAQVKKLLLAHFMLRTRDRIRQTINIISKDYQGQIIIARDLLRVKPHG